jgi:hypothetical protein
MKYAKLSHSVGTTVLIFIMMVGFSYISVLPAHGHGGKTHAEEAITALQVVQKATQLYDRLITTGKLSGAWETGLKTIKISTRNAGSMLEYVVQFETTQENSNSVYFFFNQEGAYSGSNFTGR